MTEQLCATVLSLPLDPYKTKEDVIKNWSVDRKFNSQMTNEKREKELKGWQQAVASTRGWAKEI